MDHGDLQLVCNSHLNCIFFFFYGLPDIMNDICFNKNKICSESNNFCGFLTLHLLFVVPGW